MNEYMSGLFAGLVMVAYFMAFSVAGNNGRIVLLLAFMAVVFAYYIIQGKNESRSSEPAQDDLDHLSSGGSTSAMTRKNNRKVRTVLHVTGLPSFQCLDCASAAGPSEDSREIAKRHVEETRHDVEVTEQRRTVYRPAI